MVEAGITSKQPSKPKSKQSGKESVAAPSILKRNFNPSKPNEFWCGDVTYIGAGDQWLYLAAVMDLYRRKFVGWAYLDSPDSKLTAKALQVAYESRGQPERVMFHSNQGCHYISLKFRQKPWIIVFLDGLKGFSEAIDAVYPNTHSALHRPYGWTSMKFVPWNDYKEVAADLKRVY